MELWAVRDRLRLVKETVLGALDKQGAGSTPLYMYVSVCVCVCIYLYRHIHIHIHIYIYRYRYYTCVPTYLPTYLSICVTYVRTYICMSIPIPCISTHIYIYTCIYTYIPTCILHTYICTYDHVHWHTFVNPELRTRLHVYKYMRACVHAYNRHMYVRAYLRTGIPARGFDDAPHKATAVVICSLRSATPMYDDANRCLKLRRKCSACGHASVGRAAPQTCAPHVCIYIYIYTYTYINVCIHIYMSVHMHVHICVCVHICMHKDTYACLCMYVCMYVWMYGCMHLCMYVRMYAWMYVCMYVCMYAGYVCMCIIRNVFVNSEAGY